MPKPGELDLATDGPALLASLEPTIEESLGEVMIFNLVTALKDAAEQLAADRATAAEHAREAELRAAEEKENAKFHGERVTRERFLAWRERFLAERAEEAERRRVEEVEAAGKRGGKVAKEEDKITGRQLWERGMVGKGWEDEEGDGYPVEKGVEALSVDG